MKPNIAMFGLIMSWFHFHTLEFPRVLRLLSRCSDSKNSGIGGV